MKTIDRWSLLNLRVSVIQVKCPRIFLYCSQLGTKWTLPQAHLNLCLHHWCYLKTRKGTLVPGQWSLIEQLRRAGTLPSTGILNGLQKVKKIQLTSWSFLFTFLSFLPFRKLRKCFSCFLEFCDKKFNVIQNVV